MIQLINVINKISKYIINKYEGKITDTSLRVIACNFSKEYRCYEYLISNEHLLDRYEVLKAIYKILTEDPIYKEFGNYKIIIIQAYIRNIPHAYHHNILVTNTTTFEEY
jgi:hypothetical protein